MSDRGVICGTLSLVSAAALCQAAIVIDTSIGSGPPPSTVGGYTMLGFPLDVRPPGSWVVDAAPPPKVPGSLIFSDPVQVYTAGAGVGQWNGWSHGYSGSVYFSPWTGAGGSGFAQLELTLPAGVFAFYLYLEPEISAATWNFEVTGTSVGGQDSTASLLITGGGGASYFGLYSDDLADPLDSIFIRQTSEEFLGFGIGEFGVNIPEPRTGALLTGVVLLGGAAFRRCRRLGDGTN